MNLEKLPSGSYRAQKIYKGQRYRLTFDHKPTERELTIAFAELLQDTRGERGSFEKYAREYIKHRMSVISPATVRTYNTKMKQLSDDFKKKNIYDITREDVQAEINRFAKNHAPKTTKTLHGFVASVLYANRPNFTLRTKLPPKIDKQEYEPSNDDIRRILDHVKGTRYSVPFQLAVMGCRRAELCCLDINTDLDGNKLWVHRSKVYLEGKWIVKETPKTDASNRVLLLPDKLVKEIQEQGCIYDGYPAALLKALNRVQKVLGIEKFKFHSFRCYFASYAHSIGICDADIQAIGGWATDSVMKRIYRKSLEESRDKSLKMITDGLFG